MEKIKAIMNHVPKTLDPKVLSLIPAMMKIELSMPIQQELLDCVNEMISETRADIISGNKTTDEVNVLLDDLQRLTIKKQSIESRIATINRMHDVRESLVEKKVKEALNESLDEPIR